MMRFFGLLLLLLSGPLAVYGQQSSSLTSDDAQTIGLTFSAAPGWQQGLSDPFSATTNSRGISVYFSTELYTASTPGAFDTDSTEDVLRAKWGESLAAAQSQPITAASADGVQLVWPGSRMERWFRISNDRFLVERCMSNGVKVSVWDSVVRPECEAQFNSVIVTASTLPPTYRAAERTEPAEPVRKATAPELARIPGGHCPAPSGSSETTRMASLLRHGERADAPADQFACWEAASELGSADAMTRIGQMFLQRDQLHQSEQDRTAGVVWLLVAADRYHTLLRTSSEPELKKRYQQRFTTIMDLVGALKSEKLTEQQFDAAVSQASSWKKSNMHLFR